MKLDETFGIEPQVLTTYEKQEVVKTDSMEVDIKNDYDYARENYYNLVENGNVALEDLIELAKQSEHPRAYEVVGQMIKTLGDTTSQITTLHEKQMKLNASKPEKVTNNNLFVGSATDLLDLIKK
jgi:hypothetical protein